MLAGRVMAGHTLASAVGTIEHDWRGIWMKPALGAVAVLVLFLIFFREPRKSAAAEATQGSIGGEALEEGPT